MTRQLGFPLLKTALAGLWFAALLPAPTCATCFPRFGLIGIRTNDTFRVNVLQPPDPVAPAGSCTLQLSIVQPPAGLCFDCLPTTLAGPTTITLSPGQSGGLEAAGFNATARAVLTAVNDPNNLCQRVVASVEVYDTVSKRLRLLDTCSRRTPNDPMQPSQPPDPVFPLAGVTSGDTIRLNPFFQPSDPITPGPGCTVQASIQGVNADGVLTNLTVPTTVTLNPGQSAVLAYSETTPTRRLVRPVVHAIHPADPCQNVVATAELLDTTAGRTFALYPTDPIAPM